MEFVFSFLRCHLAGKPLVASRNVVCFLTLARLTFYESLLLGQKTRCKCKEGNRKAWFDMTVILCLFTDVALVFIREL